MSKSRTLIYIALIIFIGLGLFFGFRKSPAQSANANGAKTIQVNWLLAHQPAELFIRATKIFADELAKGTNGAMAVKVLTPEDVGFPGDVPTDQVFKLLDNGTAQLSSTYAVGIAGKDPAFGVVNLPFLFKNYKSAGEVLDGPLGKQILDTVEKNTSARALAFTLSGGYRIIASKDKQIKTADDFKGLRIGTAGGPVAEEIFRELGAVPVPVTLPTAKKSLGSGDVDAVETTYTRLSWVLGTDTFVHSVSETNHSLFLTAILVSKSFYDSLTPDQQAVLQNVAQIAAKAEREDSIALAEKTKIDAQKQGIKTVALSPKDSAELAKRLEPVYRKFTPIFGADFIQGIFAHQ